MVDTTTQKHILVPLGTGSEEIEAVTIIDTLRRAGAKVTVCSVESSTTVKCSRDVVIQADCTITDLHSQSPTYDCIALPGGFGAKALQQCRPLHTLLEAQQKANKLIAAICAAPVLVLGAHDMLYNTNNIVCHPSFAPKLTVTHDSTDQPTTGHLRNGEQVEVGDRVAVDGQLVTSQGPGTTLEFALKIVELLYGLDHANTIAAPMIVNFPLGTADSRQHQRQQHSSTLANVKAVCFDAYGTVFDVYSVTDTLEKHYPGKGEAISQMWRIKQLDFSWIRSMAQTYVPFNVITTDALVTAVQSNGEMLSDDQKQQLIKQYQTLPCFGETSDALQSIRNDLGLKTALFSNGPTTSQKKITEASKLDKLFDDFISADTVRVYKPDPHTYQLACSALQLKAREVMLVSSNPFDICGAKNYGLHTVWVNRKGAKFDELGVKPDHEVKDLNELYKLLKQHSKGKQ